MFGYYSTKSDNNSKSTAFESDKHVHLLGHSAVIFLKVYFTGKVTIDTIEVGT